MYKRQGLAALAAGKEKKAGKTKTMLIEALKGAGIGGVGGFGVGAAGGGLYAKNFTRENIKALRHAYPNMPAEYADLLRGVGAAATPPVALMGGGIGAGTGATLGGIIGAIRGAKKHGKAANRLAELLKSKKKK